MFTSLNLFSAIDAVLSEIVKEEVFTRSPELFPLPLVSFEIT